MMALERDCMKQEDVLETVLRRKRQWRRKIEKMPMESLIRTVYMEEMPGKRPREIQ